MSTYPFPSPSALCNAAGDYAARGWPVFPTHSIVNGLCTCRDSVCKKPGKHPRIKDWYTQASADSEMVSRWWGKWPDANVSIAAGTRSGLAVLDADRKHSGEAALARLQEQIGALPRTLTARTGGGGLHVYFRIPAGRVIGSRNELPGFPGIEVKAEKAASIAPPSMHASGETYAWESLADPAPIPAALLDMMDPPEASASGQAPKSHLNDWKESVRAASPIVEVIGESVKLEREGCEWVGKCPFHDDHTPSLYVNADRSVYLCRACGASGDVFRWVMSTQQLEFLPAVEWLAARAGIPRPAHKPQRRGASTLESPKLAPVAEPWPETPGLEAFHGPAGEFVRALRPHTEADDVAVLVQFLLSFGSVLNRGPHFVVESDVHSTNMFAVLVGETSKGRKGTSWGHVRRLFARLDPEWTDRRVLPGLSSGEGLIWAVRDPIEKQQPIKEKGHVSGYEMVQVDPGEMDKRLLIYESEFAGPLRVMGREGNTLSAVISAAWDSDILNSMTKNSPARATGAHVSIIGHVTRQELLRELTANDSANGFANRILWPCVRRSKALPNGGHLGDGWFDAFAAKLRPVLEAARQVREMERDPEARDLWADVYYDLSEGQPGLFGAATSRGEAQVVRLSLLYALLDGRAAVGVHHLRAALALWDYCLRSARYIFGEVVAETEKERDRRRLVAVIAGRGGVGRPAELARSGPRRFRPNGKPDSESAERALNDLEKAGFGSWVEIPPGEGGGRPTRGFQLAPSGGVETKPPNLARSSEVEFPFHPHSASELTSDVVAAAAEITRSTVRGEVTP